MNRVRHMSALGLLFIVMLFELTAFALLSLRDESFDPWALIFALILVALLFLQYVCVLWISRYADRFLLVIANLLAAIGMIVQYRLSPETAFRQLILYGVGLLAMFVCIGLMHRHRIFRILNWPMILGSLAILGVLLVVGKEQGGAKNWIKIGDFSFQPSEFVKVALVFVSANYLTQQKGWRDWLPSALFAILACGLLVAERDLGAALLIAGTYLILFYTATGDVKATLVGLGSGCVGAVASYFVFDHVRARVAIWQNPWATYETSGYQIAQGLMAIASGGLWGLGLTQGSPKSIPAYNTDYIFAVICEEFGIIFGIAVIALYLVFIIRGAFGGPICPGSLPDVGGLWLHRAYHPAKLHHHRRGHQAHSPDRYHHALCEPRGQLPHRFPDAVGHTGGGSHAEWGHVGGRYGRSPGGGPAH